MRLIIARAHESSGPPPPLVQELVAPMSPLWHDEGSTDSLSTPQERALARSLGWDPLALTDGAIAWAAWERHRAGLDAAGPAWGRLTPYHGVVGSDRITLLDPTQLELHELASRQLFDAVAPLFVSEGVRIEWFSPLAWHIQHESLEGLACASVDRVVGESVQQWQSRSALGASRLIRRLQNEAQMVLYEQAQKLEGRAGLMPVNSLWLSDCGTCPPRLADAARACETPQLLKLGELEDALRGRSVDDIEALVVCGAHSSRAWTRRLAGDQKGAWFHRLQQMASGWLRPSPDKLMPSDWMQRL